MLHFSYLCADNKNSSAASSDPLPEAKDSERAFRIGIGTRPFTDEKPAPSLDHAGDIQLSAISAAQRGRSGLFHGRAFHPERVNLCMARDWRRVCEDQHERKCEFPALEIEDSVSTASPQELPVIDGRRMCLRRLPEGSRYIALSYCWPRVNTFVTSKSTVMELFTPGSLRERRNSFRLFKMLFTASMNSVNNTYGSMRYALSKMMRNTKVLKYNRWIMFTDLRS